MISSSQWQALIRAAREVSQNAYCRYSEFQVGAAVLGESGIIYRGCNVENASYGLTICAERNAVCRAIADGEKKLQAVAIYTPTSTPTAPCGACRQLLNEFGPKMPVLCVCNGKQQIKTTLAKLLPEAFGPRDLR